MKKLLVVCGPTATGKTSLALKLAKVFDGELVSADARQVYKGLDIGTGKDIDLNSKFHIVNNKYGFYEIDGVKVWGYDLVGAKENFDVSTYTKFAHEIISQIHSRGKLPILVGGTGFYIGAVTEGVETMNVPPNPHLRKKAEELTAGELRNWLTDIAPERLSLMNESDRQNPRRLVRAIEVALWSKDNSRSKSPSNVYDTFFIGLSMEASKLEKRIEDRVEKRIKEGQADEVQGLLANGVTWSIQSMSSIGYREWQAFFDGKETQEGVAKAWVLAEKQYAKRQVVWFKKVKDILWFDADSPTLFKQVENKVSKWYAGL